MEEESDTDLLVTSQETVFSHVQSDVQVSNKFL